jgi:hypothetical protein
MGTAFSIAPSFPSTATTGNVRVAVLVIRLQLAGTPSWF